jgi:hypothetical protein
MPSTDIPGLSKAPRPAATKSELGGEGRGQEGSGDEESNEKAVGEPEEGEEDRPVHG